MLARGAELIGLGPGSIEANYSSETALSLGARPCSDVPAAASNKQQAFARAHMRTRHCALSLSGGGAARALAVWARGAAPIEVGPVLIEANDSSEMTLSLGARPCCDVPAAASNEQQAFAREDTRPRHCALSLM